MECDEAIVECKQSTEEWNNAINELKWENLEKFITELDNVNSQISHLYDLLSEDDQVVNDMGEWTDEGITSLGLLAQQMELAQYKSRQYASAIQDLKADYAAGRYSTDEYNEKLAEERRQYDANLAYQKERDKVKEEVTGFIEDNKLEYVHQTSWGMTTRLIGAVIMVHGDNRGLCLPPKIAPTQAVIIPIMQKKEGVLEKAEELRQILAKAGVRVKVDDTDKSPGWKFSEQEILGIPTRIEIGPKDIENNQVVVCRRDTREKITVSLDNIAVELRNILETMQQDMYNKAKAFLDSHIFEARTLDEMVEKFKSDRGLIKACWCGDPECEGEVKYNTGGAATRCLIEDEELISDKCIYCGKPAKHMAYWGKSY